MGIILSELKHTKAYGIELDELLSWDENIIMITEKETKVIGALRRLKSYVPLSVLVIIYKSLIQPHCDYYSTSSVWGNLGKVFGCKFQKLQNRTARIITGSDYNVCSVQTLNSVNWHNLEKRLSQQFWVLMYKTINKMVPDYLSNKFTPTNVIHNHNLRHSDSKLLSQDLWLSLLRKVLLIEAPSCGIAYLSKL
jgi:hypothetical protein